MSETPISAVLPDGVDVDSAWWWEALASGQLLVPRCETCGRVFFPPMPGCPHCGASGFEAMEAGGGGTVNAWVTIHIALDDEFADDVPYTIVAVDLDEGGRIFGRLVGDTAPAAGARATFVQFRRKDMVLPGFRVE